MWHLNDAWLVLTGQENNPLYHYTNITTNQKQLEQLIQGRMDPNHLFTPDWARDQFPILLGELQDPLGIVLTFYCS